MRRLRSLLSRTNGIMSSIIIVKRTPRSIDNIATFLSEGKQPRNWRSAFED